MSSPSRYPIHQLPLPSKTLQANLEQIPLPEDTPSHQRRSQTFTRTGIWARVTPLPLEFPFNLPSLSGKSREECENRQEEQVDAEALFRAFDDYEQPDGSEIGLLVKSSKRRNEAFTPELLGISSACLEQCLPHLDVDLAAVKQYTAGVTETLPDHLRSLVDIMSGRAVLRGTVKSDNRKEMNYGPWSTRYAGHQFGQWAGQLGDGRAISILETESPKAGRQEIQLKGSGRTPFSRGADGLGTLKSGLREFLCCEAMSALGIPSSRGLAVITQDHLKVNRDHGPEQSAILARVAPSFLRIGHFEALNPPEQAQQMSFFVMGSGSLGTPKGPQPDLERLRALTEWVAGEGVLGLKREAGRPFVKELVTEVAKRNAKMVAAWQVYGFCHGVINTDNISLLGLTIDYGPWAFMEAYDPYFICNSSDHEARYDYRKQPTMVLYAIRALAGSLAELVGYEEDHVACVGEGWSEGVDVETMDRWRDSGELFSSEVEKNFMEVFKEEYARLYAERLGLTQASSNDVLDSLLNLLKTHELDYSHTLRALCYFDPSFIRPPSASSETTSTDNRLTLDSLVDYIVSSLRVESRRPEAARDVKEWLKKYAEKIEHDRETSSKENTSQAHDQIKMRREAMKKVNPRFILRRWVVDEMANRMKEVKGGERRKILNEVLAMSLNPFNEYEEKEDLGIPDKARGDPESETQGRLCRVRSE